MENIKQWTDKYKIEALQWLNLEIAKAFSDLSPQILKKARIILTTENNPEGIIKAASGRHSDRLQISVKPVGEYEKKLYLYSNVDYDITILTGNPFEGPTPAQLYIWIQRKQRRGVFSGLDAKSLSYAINRSMKKRGVYATQPFNYVGYTIEKTEKNIIDRFRKIG